MSPAAVFGWRTIDGRRHAGGICGTGAINDVGMVTCAIAVNCINIKTSTVEGSVTDRGAGAITRTGNVSPIATGIAGRSSPSLTLTTADGWSAAFPQLSKENAAAAIKID
jgi:hypothetical protein